MNGGALRFLPKPGRERPRMEFALPTINIVFLLMLYFLVAGTLAERDELSVVPPQTTPYPSERLPRPLLLVTDDGRLLLDGRTIAEDEVAASGREALDATGVSELNLLVPSTMSAAPFLGILSELDSAGVPVRLVTVERDGDP
jgi:biopolymer transport protein ExbD